jgi:hypothetical protein
MNTVPEYIALERAGYAEISRTELAQRANEIRDKTLHLADLKYCAETLKHVRKIEDRGRAFSSQDSSTSIAPEDKTTWLVGTFDLSNLLREAMAELETFPELQLR